jgi:hypothetical protein
MRRYRPAFEIYHREIYRLRLRWMEWRPTLSWAIFTTVLFVLAVLSLTQNSEFIYYNF